MSKPMINKDMTVSGTNYTLEDLCKKIDGLNTNVTNLTNSINNLAQRGDFAWVQFSRAAYSFIIWQRRLLDKVGYRDAIGKSLTTTSNGSIKVLKDGIYLVLGQASKNCPHNGDYTVEVVAFKDGSEVNYVNAYHHTLDNHMWAHNTCFAIMYLAAGSYLSLGITMGVTESDTEVLWPGTSLVAIRIQ